MCKQEALKQIRDVGIIPVLRVNSVSEAIGIAGAIESGGIPVLEVTMTVPRATDVIAKLNESSGNRILIGAGTVLDPETARTCILAGAQFIVSPSLNTATIEVCHRYGVVVFPGALTPTEVVTAWEAGADGVKVFPCSAVGGAEYLKALKGPLPQIQMIPTGGVSLQTARAFLDAGAFALGVGGDLANAKSFAIDGGASVTATANKYAAIIQAARLGQ
jgi:2-dehydro-3-deoxyphosphogluconate aldolase / (4S)-4-hydroxy-2-oxoglutarate aldolase